MYNVEKYLRKCLDSILEIKNISYEILIVNDGSPDNSQKIIDEYCKKDRRIKSFIKENGGISSARNYGIEKAQGEYIWFIDSDDFIDGKNFEKFFNYQKKDKKDVFFGNYIEFKDEDLPKKIKEDIKEYEKFNEWFYEFQKKLQTVWRGIYRLEFLKKEKILFEESLKIGEDLLFNQIVMCRTLRIKYIDIPFYFYRKNRKGSILTSNYKELERQHYKISELLSEELCKKKLPKPLKKFPIKFYLQFLERIKERDLRLEEKLWKIEGIDFFKLKIRFRLWRKTNLYKEFK